MAKFFSRGHCIIDVIRAEHAKSATPEAGVANGLCLVRTFKEPGWDLDNLAHGAPAQGIYARHLPALLHRSGPAELRAGRGGPQAGFMDLGALHEPTPGHKRQPARVQASGPEPGPKPEI